MTTVLIIIGFFIIVGFVDKIEKAIRESKEESVENYLAKIAANKIDEIIEKAERIAEENGVDLDETFPSKN